MTRILVPKLPRRDAEAAQSPQPLALERDAAHHVARVLRLRAGDPVVLFDGTDLEADATLDTVSKSTVTVRLDAIRTVSRESPLSVHLALGISRGERMDYAIQKSVELGAAELTPLVTERCVVKLDEQRTERRLAHWNQVIRSACEQSGRTRVPKLNPPQSLSGWFETLSAQSLGARFVFEPGAAPNGIPGELLNETILAVGPEGGFSRDEIDAFQLASFQPVTLGPRIMRTETAAAAAVLFAQMRWGDMRGT